MGSQKSEVRSHGNISTVDFRLYLISDRKLFTSKFLFFIAIEEALKGGVKAIQLREKDLGTRELLDMAYKMRAITNKYKAELFINDRVDIALSVEADGVHLGQQSMPVHAAKKFVKNKLMIGVSTHNIEEAREAEKSGADFITLGPIYGTPAKLKYGKPLGVDIIGKVRDEISIPIFAIGGIKEDKIERVMGAGADGIALISGILTADDIKQKTRKFLELLK